MTLGVLGGGQLGRMLALDAARLGIRVRVWESSRECCAGHVAEVFAADFSDTSRAADFCRGLDACTLEFENVPADLVRAASSFTATNPNADALATAQDRLSEKTLFTRVGIPTPAFEAVQGEASLRGACRKLGLPAVLKTRRMGYDGKGQFVLRTEADVDAAWRALSHTPDIPLILESFVRFTRELSIIACRGRDGATVFYPLTENHHAGGILRLSIAPAAGVSASLQAHAQSLIARVMDALNYVGVLALELFVDPAAPGTLVGNEIAPRVHNSGHWTQDGSATSQFENHVRAVTGLPLGDTTPLGVSAMVNIVGDLPTADAMTRITGARIHLYGKQPRPGRKVGHLNLVAPTHADLRNRLDAVRNASLPGIILPDDRDITWPA